MKRPRFYVGLHHPSHAMAFDHSMVSVNVLEKRIGDFFPRRWLMDSGAFTRIASGRDHLPAADYASQIKRWAQCGELEAAVAQDYMCEPFMLMKTNATVKEHQRWTTQRFVELRDRNLPIHLMPVIQGYTPDEYRRHLSDYDGLLEEGAWVGVGSVCKRNGTVDQVEAVLGAIYDERPDLQLHGFGLKRTALTSEIVNDRLVSCDSMAWSFAARKEGRDPNDQREAERYVRRLATLPVQMRLKA